MSQKARDYTNLRETEKLYDAIDEFMTFAKDYSLGSLVAVYWRWSDEAIKKRLVTLTIGTRNSIYVGPDFLPVVNDMLERATHDKDKWLPQEKHTIEPYYEHGTPLVIDTTGVNEECLRDHLADISIADMHAIVDLEELLKATRYA